MAGQPLPEAVDEVGVATVLIGSRVDMNHFAGQGVIPARAGVVRMTECHWRAHSPTDWRCPMQTNEFQEQVSFRDDEQTAAGIPV